MAEYKGPIADLPTAEEKVNTILYRLAKELGYRGHGGVIIAEPDEVLEEALDMIWRYKELQH